MCLDLYSHRQPRGYFRMGWGTGLLEMPGYLLQASAGWSKMAAAPEHRPKPRPVSGPTLGRKVPLQRPGLIRRVLPLMGEFPVVQEASTMYKMAAAPGTKLKPRPFLEPRPIRRSVSQRPRAAPQRAGKLQIIQGRSSGVSQGAQDIARILQRSIGQRSSLYMRPTPLLPRPRPQRILL